MAYLFRGFWRVQRLDWNDPENHRNHIVFFQEPYCCYIISDLGQQRGYGYQTSGSDSDHHFGMLI